MGQANAHFATGASAVKTEPTVADGDVLNGATASTAAASAPVDTTISTATTALSAAETVATAVTAAAVATADCQQKRDDTPAELSRKGRSYTNRCSRESSCLASMAALLVISAALLWQPK
jgi:hypothetical protein